MVDKEEIIKAISLTQVPTVGTIMARQLVSYCGSAAAVFKTPKSKLVKIPDIGEKTARQISSFNDFKRAEEELKFIERNQVRIYHISEPDYPYRLKETPDAPLIFFGHGDCSLNQLKVISVVGTRNATVYGREWTEKFIYELSESRCLVVSGLAAGIDTIAHKSALKAKLPTVGVMGNGINMIYPSQNKSLARQIIEANGAILTEYISNTAPDKGNFPERNRIVAGMSDAVIVVETKKKGGSMITAGLGFQYNRDVFALPGRITDENAEGCHHLIKTNKAALIENAADFISQMRWDVSLNTPKPLQQQLFLAMTPDETRVAEFLKKNGKIGIDELCFQLNFPQHQATMVLLEMEMKDLIRSLPGKYYEWK